MKTAWWVREVFGDLRLSIDARVVVVWIGTRRRGWRYSVDEGLTFTGWGRQKFQSVMREAKASGYLVAVRARDEAGKLAFTNFSVLDYPRAENQPLVKGPTKGRFQALGPRAENQPTLKDSSSRGGECASGGVGNVVLIGRRRASSDVEFLGAKRHGEAGGPRHFGGRS